MDVLGRNSATTVVVIDEADTDNWGIWRLPVSCYLPHVLAKKIDTCVHKNVQK